MAYPGEVRTRNQEIGLMLVRFVVFVSTFLLVSFVGMLFYLPAGVAGILGGLAAFGLIVGGSLFEVELVRCPGCGKNMKMVRNAGSFICSGCGEKMYIYGGKVEKQIEL